MRDIAFVCVLVPLLIAAIPRPWLGVLIWVWIDYMNPHRLCFGFATELPVAMAAALVAMGSAFFFHEIQKFPFTRETIVLISFIIWISVTTIFAMNPSAAQYRWEMAVKIQLLILTTMAVMRDRWRIEALVWVIVLSLGLYGIKGGIFTLLNGGHYKVYGPENTFIEDNNDIALAVVTTLPLMRYLMLKAQRRLLRWGIGAALLLTVLAALGSYSRGGLLGLCTVIVLMILKSRKRVMLLLVFLVAIPLALQFMPDAWFQRMGTIQNYEEDDSTLGRFNAWSFAQNIVKERPLTGGGFWVFTPELFRIYAPMPEEYHDAHSIYFKVLGEHGYVGLGIFLLLAILSWRSATWVRRNSRGVPELVWASDLAGMTQVAMAGYAVGGAFLNLAYFDLPYHLVAIIVLLKVLVRRHQTAALESEAAGDESSADLSLNQQAAYC